MEKILVSACLLGDKTRYDGESNYFPFLNELASKYELVPFCPEVEAGLSIPRSPAEIVRNEVFNKDGVNLTKVYNNSAEKAYRICQFLGIKIAILKDGSPACGPRKIHNGKFDGGKIDGLGVTARYLISKGIRVYCETDNLQFLLNEREGKNRRSPIEKEENKYFAQAKTKKEDGFPTKEKQKRFHHEHRFHHADNSSTYTNEKEGERKKFHKDGGFSKKKRFDMKNAGEKTHRYSHGSHEKPSYDRQRNGNRFHHAKKPNQSHKARRTNFRKKKGE